MIPLRKPLLRVAGLLVISATMTVILLYSLDRRGFVYNISRNKHTLEYCEYHPDECINQFMPQNYEKIIKQEDQMIAADGSLNEKFFREFKHHFTQRVADLRELVEKNKRIYQDYLHENISEPAMPNLARASETDYQLANATFLSLVQSQNLDGIASAVEQVESKFNKKFHYPWTFINDKPFTNKFIKKIKSLTQSECEFVQINSRMWRKPDHIDPEREKEGVEYLKSRKIQYAGMGSYHNMCRFYSGKFYDLPELEKYKYYWRVEPDTNYYSDIDYDVFKFMQDNNKTYGFTINIYDNPETVRSLWDTTVDFLRAYPQYLHKNGAYDWLLQDLEHPEHNKITNGYSTCHFWSNFEIADMDFFRSEAYRSWFEYLDESGGFYYERWGDAPVHSIGLGLFEDKSKIHWFRDIGYLHSPYVNCPNSDKCTGCEPGQFTPFDKDEDQNCMANWIKYSMGAEQFKLY